MALVPCPACARHVRSSESACPFCAAKIEAANRPVPGASGRRLERLAAFTFATTLAVTGCSLAGEDDTSKSEDELASIMPMYGMPPAKDAGSPSTKDGSASETDATTDAAPPPAEDAGPPPCTPPAEEDPGSFHAMYGMPAIDPCPVEEADAGAIMPMYGMPPQQP